ncbi:MAG TPA: hypothetical protein VNW92_13405, partial [Polyangiaceae bacterium]|nr:hypothetical protein [Polyangiaceae bacterium]
MKSKIWGHGLLFGLVTLGCSSTTGGNSGSGGASGTAGTASSSDVNLCNEQYDAVNVKCPLPADSKEGNVRACMADQQDFAGIGCKSQYDAWLVCTTMSGYDCVNDTGCETTQGAYFSCQSQATARTGCVRLGSQDTARCTDNSKPYAFSCVGAAPSQCVQVV